MSLSTVGGSRLFFGAVFLTAVLGVAPSHAGDSLRCGSRIISVDSIPPAVLAACGEPAYRDVWTYYDQSYARYVGDTEVWTYNFGPNQLLRVLRFRNGKLNSIETDGYGFRSQPDGHCSPTEIISGLSKYRLLSLCGAPVAQRALGYLFPDRNEGGRYLARPYGDGNVLSPSYREEWTYNFGSRFLLRRVMLENGRVVDVQDGERGYDPP